ncbi:haloalkane dehalogenase [Actinomadura verrucosospora]|uniref:Putative haloalkane dehalogenase, alpha/beta hydrolase family n=1 Tax=Actinomadura verrucosospora TaxID=46165 RepID=A0A7D3VSQ7_ACTVE|nr:haloalkane dehalogenase [Actinomadura verrucosospora]QKG18611.1 putative haloalkane dehalogenase, alpha/beta hydrolase family [Actinomadura verrucosospora]
MATLNEITKTDVLDSWMAHRAAGESGPTVVFLHGNPTSSYLWRNVIPAVAGRARCLAPDLIGMGASGKPGLAYRFADHARYLDAWLEAVVPDNDLVLVGHDWGGALAQDWAARRGAGRVRGIVLNETFLRPMAWSEMPPQAHEFFSALRTPGVGEEMVLKKNLFIERNLPAHIPGISEEVLGLYREPYPDADSRSPMLQWAREFPLDGEPADVVARMVAYGEWMRQSADVPKLLMTVTPAVGLGAPELIAWARGNSSSLRVQEVGQAGHHAPEQLGPQIGQAVARFLGTIG